MSLSSIYLHNFEENEKRLKKNNKNYYCFPLCTNIFKGFIMFSLYLLLLLLHHLE